MTTTSAPNLFSLIAPYRVKFITACLLSILARGLYLVPFILIYLGIAEILHPPIAPQVIWSLVGIAAIATLVRWLILAISGRFSHQIAYNILYDIRVQLAEKLGRLPLGYVNKNATGTLKKIINEDVEFLEQMFTHGLPEGIGLITTFIFTTSYLFFVDWQLALAALAGIPLALGSQYFLFKDIQPILEEYYAAQDRMNATIIEYVRGMPAIKAYTQTTESFNRYEESVRNYQYQHGKPHTMDDRDRALSLLTRTLPLRGNSITYLTSHRLVADLRLRLGNHIRQLPMGFFNDRQIGDLNSLVSDDMRRIEPIPAWVYPKMVTALTLPSAIALL